MACCCQWYMAALRTPPPSPLDSGTLLSNAPALACALFAKQKGKAKWTLSIWNIAPAAVKCAFTPPPYSLLPLALHLPKVPLYAKCVAVVIYADHPQLGIAARPQLCLGTARLGVTVLQENSFSEFHLHIFCWEKNRQRGRGSGSVCGRTRAMWMRVTSRARAPNKALLIRHVVPQQQISSV